MRPDVPHQAERAEFAPIPPARDCGPTFDPDPHDLKRDREERRERAAERLRESSTDRGAW